MDRTSAFACVRKQVIPHHFELGQPHLALAASELLSLAHNPRVDEFVAWSISGCRRGVHGRATSLADAIANTGARRDEDVEAMAVSSDFEFRKLPREKGCVGAEWSATVYVKLGVVRPAAKRRRKSL